jgi:TRAP-type C4-dicarboxylate transport system permease large subunit
MDLKVETYAVRLTPGNAAGLLRPWDFVIDATDNFESKFLILVALNVLMLIVGMPLDLPPAILLLGPIFVPLAATIGVDPVQLGLIMILNLGIGLYTPPIGTTLFISSSIAKTTLAETTKELWPFFAVAMLLLIAITYIPALTIY